jgi:outer membrane protein assembly factor BamA
LRLLKTACILRLILIVILLVYSIASSAQQDTVSSTQHCSYLKDISISGKHKTKDNIILRELSVKEDDCIANTSIAEKLEQNRLRLMNLRLFNDVKITWTPVSDDTFTMDIFLLDRFPIMPDPNFEFADRNFNVWWTEQNHDLKRINLGLTLNHNNFRGNRETVGVTAQIGYTQKVGLSYARPFADKNQKHGFGASVFGLQNREIAYITTGNKLKFLRSFDNFMQRRFDGSIWYTFRPQYASTHLVQLSFHHYWISDTIAYLNPEYLGEGRTQEDVLRLTYRYEYNGVDNWNYPLKGNRFVGIAEHKIALLSGKAQSSISLHYDHYLNPWKKWYASFIFRGRVSAGQRQPYIFRQNLGYDYDYVRGYEYYVIDGSCFGIIRANFKRELLNIRINLPIRFFEVIPLRIYGKVYGDFGAGYNKYPVEDNLNNRALYSAGVGLDIITFYDIKLRVEYTVNHLNEKGLYLHRNGE